jgi:hypothetical protein
MRRAMRCGTTTCLRWSAFVSSDSTRTLSRRCPPLPAVNTWHNRLYITSVLQFVTPVVKRTKHTRTHARTFNSTSQGPLPTPQPPTDPDGRRQRLNSRTERDGCMRTDVRPNRMFPTSSRSCSSIPNVAFPNYSYHNHCMQQSCFWEAGQESLLLLSTPQCSYRIRNIPLLACTAKPTSHPHILLFMMFLIRLLNCCHYCWSGGL